MGTHGPLKQLKMDLTEVPAARNPQNQKPASTEETGGVPMLRVPRPFTTRRRLIEITKQGCALSWQKSHGQIMFNTWQQSVMEDTQTDLKMQWWYM
jgi:hypothetical protein